MDKAELIDPKTQIYRGSRPDTLKDVFDLAQLGIKTILDLETGFFDYTHNEIYEEQMWAGQCHLKYIHIKLSNIFAPTQVQIQDCMEILTNKNNLPVYVHCLHGKDRTGMVIAAYKYLVLGQPFNEVRDDMFAHGFHKFPYLLWVHKLKTYY